jgi:hypothetical protein
LVQGLNLLFEGVEAFAQLIHGGRSSLCWTEERGQATQSQEVA